VTRALKDLSILHEAGAVGDAAVEQGTALHPDRVEEQRHGARGMNRGGQRAGGEDSCPPRQRVVDRDRDRRATGREGAGSEEGLEALPEEPSAEQAQAGAGIPEVLASQRVELVAEARAASGSMLSEETRRRVDES